MYFIFTYRHTPRGVNFMNNGLPNLTKELLDEYFKKIISKSKISQETKDLIEMIKYEMEKIDKKTINIFGYKITIEEKNIPSEDFFKLMYKKELDYLITPTITTPNLRKAKRKLKLSDEEYENKYSKKSETKRLYVREENNDCMLLKDYYSED